MQRTAGDWLAIVQTQLVRGQPAAAQATLDAALSEYPASFELRRARAGIYHRIGRRHDAEALLCQLLDVDPSDVASAFALAKMLKEQGRMARTASILRTCFASATHRRDANLAIAAIELLDDGGRKADAAAIADAAIAENPEDARLHAYAGMLQMQLGAFAIARERYMYALEHDARAWEWHVPIGIASAQRYQTADHPDFTLLERGLRREGLSDVARAELHFSLGKAHDDIGAHAAAAREFREGNAIAHRLTRWSRKAWRRSIQARPAATLRTQALGPRADFTPIFIVGMPRSGTTLLAELLSRYPRVRNRGELPHIANMATMPTLSGSPDRTELQRQADIYCAQSRQDDAGDARWFIDKQPLNFRYVDLILAMFPEAKIIHCQRNARDTALSLWMQCFLEDIQGYAHAFEDMALVMRDCDRLMATACRSESGSVRAVRYEQLVAAPQEAIGALADWIGLPRAEPGTPPATSRPSSISTASIWQARQPIHSSSVGRWRNYAQELPELMRFPAD